MLYSILADITVLLHLGFLLFAIFGGLLALWRIGWAWVHVPAFVWGVYIMLAGGICPLTPLENWFRRQAGEEAYGGAFIDHYIMPLIYPPGLTRSVQIGLALALLAFNLGIYGWVVWRYRRSGK